MKTIQRFFSPIMKCRNHWHARSIFSFQTIATVECIMTRRGVRLSNREAKTKTDLNVVLERLLTISAGIETIGKCYPTALSFYSCYKFRMYLYCRQIVQEQSHVNKQTTIDFVHLYKQNNKKHSSFFRAFFSLISKISCLELL